MVEGRTPPGDAPPPGRRDGARAGGRSPALAPLHRHRIPTAADRVEAFAGRCAAKPLWRPMSMRIMVVEDDPDLR
jgi:hypothetical protein